MSVGWRPPVRALCWLSWAVSWMRAGVPHPDVRLMRSSGRELLDAQAMDMVAQAVRVTEMPIGLRGRELRIELPVRFSLEDER